MGPVFLFLVVLSFLAIGWSAGQHLPLPPLPYEYNALEPFISEAALRRHHLVHHKAYADKLNDTLEAMRWNEDLKHLPKMGIDKLLQEPNLAQVPDEYRLTIRNAGGGFVNHALFWRCLAPSASGSPSNSTEEGKRLTLALSEAFGSVEAFKQAFTDKALQLFGSGWVWLVYNNRRHPTGQRGKGTLELVTTGNQDTPAADAAVFPLLLVDMWEHAYYLDYPEAREEWLTAFWKLVNWQEVANNLSVAITKGVEQHTEGLEREHAGAEGDL